MSWKEQAGNTLMSLTLTDFNMRSIFLYLLRKFSKTEKDRMQIYRELWNSVCEEYNEQTIPGNVYNINTEMLLANPYIQEKVFEKNVPVLSMLKRGLSVSFDKLVKFIGDADLAKKIEDPAKTFSVSKSQEEAIKRWQKSIKLIFGKYGDYTYSFRSNGIGEVLKVKSHLTGEKKDFSEIETW